VKSHSSALRDIAMPMWWLQHDGELVHPHAVVADRRATASCVTPVGRPVGRTEARAVTESATKLMSFVVRCGTNGARELK